LVITADNQTKVYGAVLPLLTVSYTGFVNGDTSASLTTLPSVTTTATAGSDVGSYPITASGAASPNYTMSYVDGTLTVTPAPLTVTADNQSMTYGGTVPALTYTYTGLVNGDTSAGFTGDLAINGTSPYSAGAYGITRGNLAATGNYTIGTYNAGTLTVMAAPLTVTADNQSMSYGGTVPALTYTYTGLVNGDTSASFTGDLAINGMTPYRVGTYGIIRGTLNATGNYTIATYIPGTLTVDPASLLITANNKTKVYGAALPLLTVSYTGFVNGDTSASLTTLPSVITTATAGSAVGVYLITASGAASPNYTISYVDGALTVTAAPLTVTAGNKSMTYGGTVPVLTYTYTGLVNGDSSASFTGDLAINGTSPYGVGTYGITRGTLTATGNYSIGTFNTGILTVGKALLTIAADNKTKPYGAVLPALTVSFIGFVNGDSSTSLTTPPSVTTTAMASSNVGSYPITASGAMTPNYTISYVAGTLTVTAATTSTSLSTSLTPSTYGQSVTFTATVTPQYSGTPTGTVIFKDNGNLLGTGTARGGGVWIFSTTKLTVTGAAHNITAEYTSNSSNFSGSSGTLTGGQTVKAATTTTISMSPASSAQNQSVTFIATVSHTVGTAQPTGTVAFYDGPVGSGTLLGTGTWVSTGKAKYITTALPPGSHTVYAVYSGDETYLTSTSGLARHTVYPPPTSLSASIVQVGSKWTLTVTALTAGNTQAKGYNAPVSFSVVPPSPGRVSGTTSGSFANGRIQFTGLSFSTKGLYTIKIVSGSLTLYYTFSVTTSGRLL
jgi:hypothetical protein